MTIWAYDIGSTFWPRFNAMVLILSSNEGSLVCVLSGCATYTEFPSKHNKEIWQNIRKELQPQGIVATLHYGAVCRAVVVAVNSLHNVNWCERYWQLQPLKPLVLNGCRRAMELLSKHSMEPAIRQNIQNEFQGNVARNQEGAMCRAPVVVAVSWCERYWQLQPL